LIIREVIETKTPTIFLGSGASISTGISLDFKTNFPSMAELAKRYHENAVPANLTSKDAEILQSLGKEFISLGKDWKEFNLEAFLANHPLRLDSLFLKQIIRLTAEAFEAPHEAFINIIQKNPDISYPLRNMLMKLLQGCPVSHPELCIITPNYDLLIEFTADLLGVPCITGFSGMAMRQWQPQIDLHPPTNKRDNETSLARRFRLIKPHGSYAWFQLNGTNQIIEYFSLHEPSGNWRRCMIAPGPAKYADALKDVRRDHIRYMDAAFQNAKSLIIIGYGFNDPHLETPLKRCLDNGIPAIIVSRELSDATLNTYVKPCPKVTCILSDNEEGSLILQDGQMIPIKNEKLWEFDNFVAQFIN